MTDAPRLYSLLEVEQTASQEEIKKSYRKLALKYHPDKAGEEGRDQFIRIQEAYNILSDETKRRVYDQHGERGVEMLNNPYAGAVVSNLEAHVLMIFLAVGLIVFSTLLILLSAFISAKVDGKVSWNWGSVLVPVWIWDFGVACFLLYALVAMMRSPPPPPDMSDDERRLRNKNKRNMVLGQIIIWCYVIFSILVGIGLSREPNNKSGIWALYFVIPLIAEALLIFLSYNSFFPTHVQASLALQSLNASRTQAWVLAMANFVLTCWKALFLVLIMCNVAPANPWLSWYVVMLPVIFALLAAGTAHGAISFIRVKNDPKLNSCHAVSWIIQQAIGLSMIFISVVLVAHKIEDGGSRTLATCLVPIFILEGMLWVFSGILLLASCRMADQELKKEEEMEEMRRTQRQEQNTAEA